MILHSYSTDFRWTRDLDSMIREGFLRYREGTTVIESEFLGTKHHNSPDYFYTVARFLSAKHAGRQFDVIIVTDNLALEFLRSFRNSVFGAVPTVFAGINEYEPSLVDGLSLVTGVAEDLSVRETIEFALNKMEGNRVFVFGDGTVTSVQNVVSVQRALKEIKAVEEVTLRSPITQGSFREIASAINPKDIVILVGSITDDDGRVIDFEQAGRIVSTLSPAPVFSFWDFFIGTGVAGGKLAGGREQGPAAVHLAKRILDGADVESIPVVRESPNRWIFDCTALEEAGIDCRHVPAGAILLNHTASMWDQYRGEIVTSTVIVVLLLGLIGLLVVNIRNRELITGQLKVSLKEKEVLLKEIHHRVKNNLQVISSILNMQGTMIADPVAHSYVKDCETRVHSMSLVHEQLYQSSTLSAIEMRRYIDELVNTLIGALSTDHSRITVRRENDPIAMDLDHAIPVGLVLNELLSIAFKYAYPDGNGTVGIRLSRGNDGITLSVRDDGIGLNGGLNEHDSLGIQLVRALAAQLGGVVEFRDREPGLEVYLKIAPDAETVTPTRPRRSGRAADRV
ncbi:MAG: sensor histidine kinase [Alkalispirochaeta sp.]